MDRRVAILIAEASTAWNEVWQGYPDHWMKVSGSLSLAAELIDDENPKLEHQLVSEASLFSSAISQLQMYRPPFEKMAAIALNLHAGREVIRDADVIGTQLCYDCAVKHLTEAKTAWSESDPMSWMDALGNLGHASNHLVERHPQLANAIREDRKRVWEGIVGASAYLRPTFEEHIQAVFEIAKDQNKSAQVRKAQDEELERLFSKRPRQ